MYISHNEVSRVKLIQFLEEYGPFVPSDGLQVAEDGEHEVTVWRVIEGERAVGHLCLCFWVVESGRSVD